VELSKTTRQEPQDSSHYFQARFSGKKPSASTSIYLRAAASNQFGKVEALPPTKEHWSEYERLRVLAFRLRKNAGSAWWYVLVVAAVMLIVIACWIARTMRNSFFYLYPHSYLRVVQNLDPCQPDGSCGYRFVMQAVVNGQAQEETEMHFCRGLQPRFEQGHTLRWIRYTNLGSCNAIDGYDVVRENGLPTLPANCKPDYSQANEAGHIRCEGGKARF